MNNKGLTWLISTIFVLVGFFLALVLPYFITPKPSPNAIRLPGTVQSIGSQFLSDDIYPVFYPVITYKLPNGNDETFRSRITSDKQSYEKGERVIVIVDPTNPAAAFIENEKNLALAIWVSRIIAAMFLLVGGTMLILLIKNKNIPYINRIGWLLGILSLSIPASLVLPCLWFLYKSRPNLYFRESEVFSLESMLISGLFSTLGLVTTVVTIALYRYLERPESTRWSWVTIKKKLAQHKNDSP